MKTANGSGSTSNSLRRLPTKWESSLNSFPSTAPLALASSKVARSTSVASMNHTRSRDEAIDFSITYFWDNQSFLVRTGEYENIDQLFDQTVAASAGSSSIDSWNSYAADAGGSTGEIVEFEDKLAAVEAVRSGAVEGYTEDNITCLLYTSPSPRDATLSRMPSSA